MKAQAGYHLPHPAPLSLHPSPLTKLLRRLFHLAWPVLIGQFASMGMMVSDTMQVARYATADLAAVAVGSGIYISVIMALVGILSALSPTIAHLYGARRNDEIGAQFQQGIWLALFLSVAGTLALLFPDPLLALSRLEPPVEAKVRSYLLMLAFAAPPVMLYRAFAAFNQAIGRPRPMMVIALAGTAIHVPLSYALIHGAGPFPELGALGCGISNFVVALLACVAGALWLSTGAVYRPFRLFADWQRPHRAALGGLLRLGAPMGFSGFVETTSFTLIAVFVARLGAEVVAGHRVIANLHALMFMMPLSLGIATLVLVGHSAGARDWSRARATALTGMAVASALAVLFGLAVWFGRETIVATYSPDPAVQTIALGLIGYSAAFLVFDAAHTLASFSLRGFKVSFIPMLIHVVSFWGVGLAGGWWLAFRGIGTWLAPMGAAGFWLMALLATALALALVGWLLVRVTRRHIEEARATETAP